MIIFLVLLIGGLAKSAQGGETAARAIVHGSADFDGFKGNHSIRTDPPTVTGVGYIHTMQVDTGSAGGDFVAIGTAKGVGVGNCSDDYDADWSLYTDGVTNGVYFCNDESLDAYQKFDNPAFSITWEWCPSASANRWLMTMSGVVWACYQSSASSGAGVAAGLETTGSSNVDRNIDVKYTNLKTNVTGTSTWGNFGSGSIIITDPSYSNSYVTTNAFNVYLAPLN